MHRIEGSPLDLAPITGVGSRVLRQKSSQSIIMIHYYSFGKHIAHAQQ